MRRPVLIRFAALTLAVFMTTAPAFAAARPDGPGAGFLARAIERIVKEVRRIIGPTPFADASIPK